eukprot:scaffold16144_cov30-Tisochrysis_lutea.AAC.2
MACSYVTRKMTLPECLFIVHVYIHVWWIPPCALAHSLRSHIFVLRVVILIVIDLYVAPSSARARSAVAAAVRGAGGPNVVAVANESKGAALCAALAIPSCKRNEGAIKKAKDRRQ